MAAGDGHAGRKAQGSSVLRALRARVRHPGDAAACSCGRFRSARARRPSSIVTTVSDGRSLRTSRSARRASGPCSARSTTSSSPIVLEFLDGDHSPVLDRLDKQMHGAADSLAEYERRGTLARPDHVGAQGHRASADGRPKEEDFDCIGLAEDALEASVQVFLRAEGRVVGRKGPSWSTRSRTSNRRARRPHSRAALRRRPGDRRAPRGLVLVLPDGAELYEVPDHGTRSRVAACPNGVRSVSCSGR
jgi:hypothetical protein